MSQLFLFHISISWTRFASARTGSILQTRLSSQYWHKGAKGNLVVSWRMLHFAWHVFTGEVFPHLRSLRDYVAFGTNVLSFGENGKETGHARKMVKRRNSSFRWRGKQTEGTTWHRVLHSMMHQCGHQVLVLHFFNCTFCNVKETCAQSCQLLQSKIVRGTLIYGLRFQWSSSR